MAAHFAPSPTFGGPVCLLPEDEARLSPGQQSFVRAVTCGRHVFLTGRAGCGKTEAIFALTKALKRSATPFAVAASTGIAAEPLRGTTVHSLLCLNDALSAEVCARRLKKLPAKLRTVTAIQVLIIDEVSMLSEHTLTLALTVLKMVRSTMPVLVLAGDFLQLPPVKADTLLGSKLWMELDPAIVYLRDSFRHRDDVPFGTLLDECRYGSLSEESVRMLESRLDAPFPDDTPVTEIHAHREAANRINAMKLAALGEDATYTYLAHIFYGSDTRSEEHALGFGEPRLGEMGDGDGDGDGDDFDCDGDDYDFDYTPSYVKWEDREKSWFVDVSEVPPSEPLWFWAKETRGTKRVPPECLITN